MFILIPISFGPQDYPSNVVIQGVQKRQHMNRRHFILAALASFSAIGFGSISNTKYIHFDSGNSINTPEVLSNFFSDDAIADLGRLYLEQVPAERSREKLQRLLLTDSNGTAISDLDDEDNIASVLRDRARRDFRDNRIVYLEGWELSITEARQCALYFLNVQKS